MKNEMVGSLSNQVFDLQIDLLQKLKSGAITVFEMKLFLRRENPFIINAILLEWQEFYRKYFRITVDFSKVVIPENPGGYSRVILIPKGLKFSQVIKALRRRFKVSLYREDLDKDVIDNIRSTSQSYAILIRDRVEADEELKNLSADQLKVQEQDIITLMERLILELKYYDETGEHLDIQNWTLCAGSRSSDGGVPRVDWHSGGAYFRVVLCSSGKLYSRFRGRSVVS
ncbi:MAG: hypothetical protein ABH884_04485 [Candidatus Komeilibacteria bacterium]